MSVTHSSLFPKTNKEANTRNKKCKKSIKLIRKYNALELVLNSNIESRLEFLITLCNLIDKIAN